jgi:hypothetical protein
MTKNLREKMGKEAAAIHSKNLTRPEKSLHINN